MNEQSPSSFIPKKPVRGSSRPRPIKRVYLISVVASVLFVTSLLASGGLFVYTIALERDLAAEQQRLNEQRETFNQSDMERALEFEARLQAANQIFNQQVYLPTLLQALEETALQSTVYRGLSYEKSAMNDINITLDTTNPTFDGVLFQREVLTSNKTLQGVSFTDVSFELADANIEDPAQVVNQVQFTIEHSPHSSLLQRNQPQNIAPAPTAVDTDFAATSTTSSQDTEVFSDVLVDDEVASTTESATNDIF